MALSAQRAGQGRRKALTRDEVLHSIRRWHALFGEPPTTADWNPSLARWRAQEWRIERYREGDPETGEPWPSVNACKRVFGGSFGAAVRAAGLTPHRPGPRSRKHADRPPTSDGSCGPAELAAAVRSLVAAHAGADPTALDAALGQVATVALRWRERL